MVWRFFFFYVCAKATENWLTVVWCHWVKKCKSTWWLSHSENEVWEKKKKGQSFVLTAPLSHWEVLYPLLAATAVGLLAATEQQQLGSSAVAQAVSMGTVPKDLLQGGDAPGWPVCFLATCSIQFEKSFEVDGWKVLNKIDAPLSRENDDMEIGWESRKCVGWIGKHRLVFSFTKIFLYMLIICCIVRFWIPKGAFTNMRYSSNVCWWPASQCTTPNIPKDGSASHSHLFCWDVRWHQADHSC